MPYSTPSKRRYVRVAEENASQAATDVANQAVKTTAFDGIDANPKPIPGESNKGFKKRMAKLRAEAEGRLVKAKDEDYQEAFRLFCDGIDENKNPTVTEVGLHLKMHLPTLLQMSINGKWELLRANAKAASQLALNEARLQLARRIDGVIYTVAEEVILKASEAYKQLIAAINDTPIEAVPVAAGDGLPVPSPDEPEKKPIPREKMIRWKTDALNNAVGGFMDMAESARTLGLVIVPGDGKKGNGADGHKPIESGKLVSFNVLLMEAQAKSNEPINVTP